MLADQPFAVFVATTDADRARAFYVDVLGLRFVEDSPFALVLEGHGTTLRVQKVKTLTPHPFTQLGWRVTDVRGLVAALTAKGVAFLSFGFPGQDETGVWTTPDGAHIAWFKDPDGNTLSLNDVPQSAESGQPS